MKVALITMFLISLGGYIVNNNLHIAIITFIITGIVIGAYEMLNYLLDI